jgi:hypothetical protein
MRLLKEPKVTDAIAKFYSNAADGDSDFFFKSSSSLLQVFKGHYKPKPVKIANPMCESPLYACVYTCYTPNLSGNVSVF